MRECNLSKQSRLIVNTQQWQAHQTNADLAETRAHTFYRATNTSISNIAKGQTNIYVQRDASA